MKVPFVDLRRQHIGIQDQLSEVFQRVVEQSSFILGPEIQQFEKAFAEYLGVSDCVTVSSGTAALQLVMQACGIGRGDEVITVPNTFIATAEAITATGATPVFVDVDPVSYTMDPDRVEAAITPRTRAILPVHLYGQPADLDPLLEIARRYQLEVIEDACQAHGAEYKGKMAGSIGTAGCFSFYPSKNLGCLGEGGAIATNRPEVAAKARLLRDHGSIRKYEHAIPAYNFRLEGLQGGILSVKLKHLDEWNQRRRALADHYRELLHGAQVVLPFEMSYAKHVYHLFVVQVADRDLLRQQLTARGIESGLHYPCPLHLQKAYAGLNYRAGDFPVAERLAERLLSLPMYPELTEQQVGFVAWAILNQAASPRAEVAVAS